MKKKKPYLRDKCGQATNGVDDRGARILVSGESLIEPGSPNNHRNAEKGQCDARNNFGEEPNFLLYRCQFKFTLALSKSE